MSLDNNHINNEFVDQSWEHMQVLLDQEMPLKRENKWFAIFFLLGILVLIPTMYFLSGTVEHTDPNSENLNERKILAQVETNENEHRESIHKLTTSVDLLEQTAKTRTQPYPNFASFSSSVNKKTDYNQSTTIKNSNSIVDKGSQFLSTINPINNRVIKNVVEIDDHIKPNVWVESISPLDAKRIEYTAEKPVPNSISPTTRKWKDRLRFSFGPSANTTMDISFVGYGGFFNAYYRFNNKLSILAGVELNRNIRLEKPAQYNAVTFAFPAPVESFDNDPYPVVEQNLTNHYDNLNTFVDLTMPIGIQYELFPFMNITAGIALRNSMYKEVQGYALHIQDQNLELKDNYNRSFINPFLAFGFDFSQKVGLQLKYEHGTKSIVNDQLYPNSAQAVSFLNLGMMYKFY